MRDPGRRRSATAHDGGPVDAIVDRIPAAVWTTDRSLRITSSRGAALPRIGLRPGELVGRSLSEFMSGDPAAAETLHAHRRALAGETVDWDVPFAGRSFEVHIEPLVDDQGRVEGCIGIALDQTERRRAEAALRLSGARRDAILSTALDAIVIMAADGRVVEWNPAAEALFGYGRDEALGRSLADLIVPPRLREAHRRAIERYLSTGTSRLLGRRVQVSALRRDGLEVPVELSIVRLAGEGAPTFAGFVRDLSDVVRARERQLLQFEVTRVLARAATLEEAAPALLAAFGVHRRWGLGALWTADAGGVLRCARLWRASESLFPRLAEYTRRATYLAGQGALGHLLATGRPFWSTDRGGPPDVPRQELARAEGVRSACAFPIVAGGRVAGALELMSPDVHPPDQEEQRVLADLAEQVGHFLERRAAEEARAEAWSLTREVFESAADGLAVCDRDLRYLAFNPAMERITGRRSDEVLGRRAVDVFPELREKGFDRLLEAALAGEVRQTPDASFTDPRGVTRWVSAVYGPHRNGRGEVVGVVASVRDITARKRAEAVQGSFGAVARAALEASDLPTLFRALHWVVAEHMPASSFSIALHDRDADTLRFPYFVDEREGSAPAPRAAGRGLTEYVLRTGRALLASPEVFKELCGRGEVDLGGGASVDWLGVPLTTRRGIIGVLAVQTYDPGHRYTEEQRDILAFVATQAGLAVERRLAEDALRASEERFRALVERSGEGISLLDREGRTVYVAPSTTRLLGHEPEVALGKSAFELLHRDDVADARRVFEEVVARPAAVGHALYRQRHRDGSWRWMEATVTNMLDVPYVGAVVANYRDVTARKRAEERARDLADLKTSFMVVTSHEMRTPLTVLQGYVELLRQDALGPLSAGQKKAVAACARSVDRLVRSFDDVVSMMQIEEARVTLRRSTVDLGALVREVVEELHPFAERRGQKVRVLAGGVRPLLLDASRMRLALVDLLENAIKFTPDGGEIRVSVREKADGVHLVVEDTGIGIPADELERVFERFYAGDDPLHHGSGQFEFMARGHGLGLALVRGFVEAHGGRVWAESGGPGAGAAFHVVLPRSPGG